MSSLFGCLQQHAFAALGRFNVVNFELKDLKSFVIAAKSRLVGTEPLFCQGKNSLDYASWIPS